MTANGSLTGILYQHISGKTELKLRLQVKATLNEVSVVPYKVTTAGRRFQDNTEEQRLTR